MHLRSRKDKTRTKNFFSFRPLIWNFQHGFFFMRDVIMWYKLDLPRHVSIISCSSCVQLLIDETNRSVVNLMGINNGSPFLFLLETSYDEEGKSGKFQQRKTEKIADEVSLFVTFIVLLSLHKRSLNIIFMSHALSLNIFVKRKKSSRSSQAKEKKETCQIKISIINSLVFIYYAFKRVRGSACRLFLYIYFIGHGMFFLHYPIASALSSYIYMWIRFELPGINVL